ncbi:hypothetical protein [Microbacterium elymi]|uniref:ABC transporter permease n=1 Tax=Microbacterium elymi TaxID=2909587 RepID=A0ABY5NH39_9MICO|nr:hypothetical protein [Microbacterium elymi]UUT34439.1 hypothetical protein L2X98_27990 [Microbacterium elymi]
MVGYIIRRLLQAVLVVLVVTIIVFLLLDSLPGGRRGPSWGRARPRCRSSSSTSRTVWISL